VTVTPTEAAGPAETTRLTGWSHGAGCGCKLSQSELQAVMGSMTIPMPTGPEVIVGPATADDAGVFRLGPDLAMVQTVDVFTPIVDDPFDWGRIAAVNALSDVYAMGGRPVAALNVVCWPRDLGFELLGRVLDGASSVLATAGCAVLGGHSIDDPEPKFGLAVTGLVDPRHLLTNAAARPGDALVLTKALGTGIATTALKADCCPADLAAVVIESMTTPNDVTAEAAVAAGVRAATDVTGFGLLGHLREMVDASGVRAVLDAAALPAFAGLGLDRDDGLVRRRFLSGGTRRNRQDAEAAGVDFGDTPERIRWLACDAQTSGGLLLAVDPAAVGSLLVTLALRGRPAWRIGRLDSRLPGRPPITLQ